MFNIECILYLLIILYSLFYQLYVIVLAKKNSHIEIKDGSGLFVSKDVLNENKLGTLYVTKTIFLYYNYKCFIIFVFPKIKTI